MNTAQRLIVAMMVIVIGVAAMVAFLPLPDQGGGSTCGPGSSSASAIYVWVFPDSVTQGQVARDPSQQAELDAFQSRCKALATTRLETIAVVIVAALVIGVVIFAVFDPRNRRMPPPPTPSAPI